MLSKVAFLAELDRVLCEGAVWMFPHLHNALQANPACGVPLSPRGWDQLLDFAPHRIVSEPSLLHDFVVDDACDLSRQQGEDALDICAALGSVISRSDGLWRRFDGLSSALAANLETFDWNPIWKFEHANGRIKARPGWPTEAMRDECVASFDVLPHELDLMPRYRCPRQTRINSRGCNGDSGDGPEVCYRVVVPRICGSAFAALDWKLKITMDRR